MAADRITSLAKTLLPSSSAAWREGPNTRSPSLSNASTSPATSGASGPTTVRSIRSLRAKSNSPAMSVAASSRFTASRAVPALPGAQKISFTRGLERSFQASACSRPPCPTIRIFIPPRAHFPQSAACLGCVTCCAALAPAYRAAFQPASNPCPAPEEPVHPHSGRPPTNSRPPRGP